MPEYLKIGSAFQRTHEVFGGDYVGPVIVSKDAFFLVVEKTPAQTSIEMLSHVVGSVTLGAGAVVAGVVGHVVGEIVSEVLPAKRHAFQWEYAQIPEEITGHSDWPLTSEPKGPVIVIPRDAVDQIWYSDLGSLY